MSNHPTPDEPHFETWLQSFSRELAGIDLKACRLLYTVAWANGWCEHRQQSDLKRYYPLPRKQASRQ